MASLPFIVCWAVRKTLIEKLKDPKQAQPYWMLYKYHPEAAKIIAEAKPEELLYVTGRNSDWRTPKGQRCPDYIYIIKSDYQPPQEYVDLPIIQSGGLFGIDNKPIGADNLLFPCFPHQFVNIGLIMAIWTFRGCYNTTQAVYVPVDEVANYIENGNTVVAHFRKE